MVHFGMSIIDEETGCVFVSALYVGRQQSTGNAQEKME